MDFLEEFLLYEHLHDAERGRRLRQIGAQARSMTFPGAPEDETDVLRRENQELRLCLAAVVKALLEKQVLQPGDIERQIAALLPETPEPPPDPSEVISLPKIQP